MTAGATPLARSKTVVRCSTDRRLEAGGWRLEVGGWRLGEGAEEPAEAASWPSPNLQPPTSAFLSSDINLPVLSEDRAHRVRYLADCGMRLDGAEDGGHEIVRPARRGRHRVERRAPGGLVAGGPHVPHALDLPRLHGRIDLHRLDRPRLVRRVAVDADDDAVARVDPLLRLVRGVLD